MPLPATYLRARRTYAKREITLDWRKLAKTKPPLWPGMLFMYSPADVKAETARIEALLGEPTPLVFFGTNSAGLLYAFDAKGAVVLCDDCAPDEPVPLAKTFDQLAKAFVRPVGR